MAETPETPTPSLAERLITEAGILSNLGYPGRVNETIGLLAEAAVQVLDMEAQLRQLDRIKAALPPDEIDLLISHHQDRCNVCAWSVDECDDYRILTAVVDALEADDGA